jgi:ubiquinone/menaquinone biosynthesis C-methylase UbiE
MEEVLIAAGTRLNQPKTVFNENADEYDRWFDENEQVYQFEIQALRRFIPEKRFGLEIGVGTGRFSIPLGISIGVDPAAAMAQIAKARGISVVQAKGEGLPFRENLFDFALMVTVICFVKNVPRLLHEARRVLKKKGRIVIGFIDRESILGRLYESRKYAHKFFREAHFFSVPEVTAMVRQAGFSGMQFSQAIFGLPGDGTPAGQVRDGYGDGAFVVLSATK